MMKLKDKIGMILVFQIFGNVNLPPGVTQYGDIDDSTGGLTLFITNILKTIIVLAGVYALLNFILAGYSYMSAGGDPKKISDAWAKIWQTVLGLIIATGAFVITGIISQIFFGNMWYLLKPRLFGP